LGSSQASAFTSAICSGGKTARAARALPIIEPRQPLFEKALPPAADKIGSRLEPTRDLRVALPVSGVQDHLRPHHHLVRQRVTSNTALQLGPLLAAQLDHEPAPPRHNDSIRRRAAGPSTNYRPNFRTVVLDLQRRDLDAEIEWVTEGQRGPSTVAGYIEDDDGNRHRLWQFFANAGGQLKYYPLFGWEEWRTGSFRLEEPPTHDLADRVREYWPGRWPE
jgi:hypothetical protein